MWIERGAALAAAIVAVGLAERAQAQSVPDEWKPVGNVEFVVGAGAGGSTVSRSAGTPDRSATCRPYRLRTITFDPCPPCPVSQRE